MAQTLYETNGDGSIEFNSERRAWNVDIPAYVYDLWMPLIGAEAIGIYGTYCRLERQGKVKGLTMRKLATKCRVGSDTLATVNQMLETCGFIRVKKPEGADRANHKTTEIITLDPPTKVTLELINLYRSKSESWQYEPLTPWLTNSGEEPKAETLDKDSMETLDKDSYLYSLSLGSYALKTNETVLEHRFVNEEPVIANHSQPALESPAVDEPSPEPTPTGGPPPVVPAPAENLSNFGFGDEETVRGAGEEEPENRKGLALVIANAYEKASYCTDAQIRQLKRTVLCVVDGKEVEKPSPWQLYEEDVLFAKFVTWAIGREREYAKKNGSARASRTNIVDHIRGYNRLDGWLKWESENRVKEERHSGTFQI